MRTYVIVPSLRVAEEAVAEKNLFFYSIALSAKL